jgi:Domain of unknown function (DUF4747)
MARERLLKIGALNIVTHPHSAKNYINLFRTLQKEKLSIVLAEHYHCRVASLHLIEKEKPEKGLQGMLYKYLHIDENEEWLNSENNEVATKEELAKVTIPKHLLPGLTAFSFIFYPKSHKLIFEIVNEKGRSLGAQTAKKAFTRLFECDVIKNKFGDVLVHIESNKDILNQIYNIKSLESLTYEIVMPNADDHVKTERQVKARFAKHNILKENNKKTAMPGESLVLDKEDKNILFVAASNGFVQGKGKDNIGKPESHTTKNAPLEKRHYYDSDTQTRADAFEYKAGLINNDLVTDAQNNA